MIPDLDETLREVFLDDSDALTDNVTSALLEIARALNEIAAALQGPWPTALAAALRGEEYRGE